MASAPSTEIGGSPTSATDFVQIYIIDIDIKGANNLIKADMGWGAKSDPYCTVSALGRSFQTETIMKTLDPEWNAHTQFCFFDDPGSLKFKVVDWDASFNNDPIGDVDFSLDGFFDPNHAGFDGSVNLLNVKSGTLNLGIRCKRLVPHELEERCVNLQTELEEQRNNILSKTERNANTKEENAQQTAANITAQDELTDVNRRNEEIQQQIADLNKEITDLQAGNKSTEDEIANLQTELREVEGKRDEVQTEVDDMRRQCDELETKNEGLTQQIQDVEARIREAETAKAKEVESQRLLDQQASDDAAIKPAIVSDDPTPSGGGGGASLSSKQVDPEENEPQGCHCIIA